MNYDKMDDCFTSLKHKVNDALDNSDLKKIAEVLNSINGPTLVCGVGGSSIVATYLAKVLREKRHIIATFVLPRDLLYMDTSAYENVIAVSYSGGNIGVDVIFETDLKKYLFTGNPREGVENIVCRMLPELSYVSVSATIVPLSILFMYYCNDRDLLNEILDQEIESDSNNTSYEVLSGYETITAATLLESSIIESGMATCVLHEKYNYCHGRINITKAEKADLIFFRMDNELDELFDEVMKRLYKNIICIDRRYEDDVINDLYASVISMKLMREIAHNKNIDFSDMKELVDNDLFYRFNGKM